MESAAVSRCRWVNCHNQQYIHYHDSEWGKPHCSDGSLYELLILESFQAGLSWECILNKREGFRTAYDGFDIEKVLCYGTGDMTRLQMDQNIIRHPAKIAASIVNTRVFRNIQEEFSSFAAYIWHFTDGAVIHEPYNLRTESPLSTAISADLKKRGMSFIGSVSMYSFLQAAGIINGHGAECFLYTEV